MNQKVRFKDLSGPLKTAVAIIWFIILANATGAIITISRSIR